jgi:hypothetical protein
MGVTRLKRVENRSRHSVTLLNFENQSVLGHAVPIGPGAKLDVDMWIPWSTSRDDFFGRSGSPPIGSKPHRLELQFDGQTRFWIWQAGDFVRFSTDGAWYDQGERVQGVAAVGLTAIDGVRTMLVMDDGFDLVDFPLEELAALYRWLDAGGYRISDDQPADRGVASVPKRSAVAFSMAGIPSDAYDRGEPGARFLYRDSGKRYEFRIEDRAIKTPRTDEGGGGENRGVVVAIHPDGSRTDLTEAVSYTRKRAGEPLTAPSFDLVAASGGRVFAKEQGRDRFYFLTMDHIFIHSNRLGGEFPVPSSYFKLDPEFNRPDAKIEHLTGHFAGFFANHPAAERFPFFRALLEQGLTDMMMVRVERCKWHLIDARAPLGLQHPMLMVAELIRHPFADLYGFLKPVVDPLTLRVLDVARRLATRPKTDLEKSKAKEVAPPDGVPGYEHVRYSDGLGTISLQSIDFRRVLDIGVGHAHHHDQYERVTGGELQPLRTSIIAPAWVRLYQIANGPVYDGDGYVDGTCNFYALVQLANGAYALLYLDEQSYFTQRWRLVDPVDHNGLLTAVASALDWDYHWRPETYWCPFRAGLIGPRSRLAVARQVLLVTGDPSAGAPEIYSINYSYSTMDRTWRWRPLPAASRFLDAGAVARGDEPIPADPADGVYPQTIRLREDMTIHLRGTHQGEVGRWYQRYLPATNRLTPPASELVPGERPRSGYSHPWKFVPETVFQRADRFSHFGVYADVDSRTQYYLVEPVLAKDAQVLADGGPGPWVDEERQLSIDMWEFRWPGPVPLPLADIGPPAVRFRWAAPLHLGIGEKLTSLFNPDTRLRIVNRGTVGWIAMHWDKRDDDLLSFEGLPKEVWLRNGASRARIRLNSQVWAEEPPVVQSARFSWTGNPSVPVALTFSTPQDRRDFKHDARRAALVGQEPDRLAFENVWRVRVAALREGPTGQVEVVPLLDESTGGHFTRVGAGPSGYEYRLMVPAAQTAGLTGYCTSSDAVNHGTSVWFEDVVGHVSVPEDPIRWLPRQVAVRVEPSPIHLGALTRVVVRAQDPRTGADVPAKIRLINYNDAGMAIEQEYRAGTPFDSTFHAGVEFIGGEELRPGPKGVPKSVPVEPSGEVIPDGSELSVASIPFVFDHMPAVAAVFVSQSVPTSIGAGQRMEATVTMQNTGYVTWTSEAGFKLGSQNPQDGLTWGLSRVELSKPCASGSFAEFRFVVTAPSTPGAHNFQWRMVQESVQWFGGWTPNVAVSVQEPAECARLRSEIGQRRERVRVLTKSKVGLNPRDAGDREEISQINQQISKLDDQITALQQQAAQLGCR